MSDSSPKNLSEQLFAPRQTTKETSSLVKLAHVVDTPVHNALDGDSEAGWYRVLRRPQWIWQGIDPIEMEAIFARMANADAPRTRDELLDTVIGYKPGNWVYEWSQVGGQYQKAARALLDNNAPEQAAEQLLSASMYYSIAAYPHLKGDGLAAQAEVQANQTYRDAMAYLPHQMRTIDVKYENKTFQAFIHLPRTDKLLPTVIVSGGLDTLQSDLLRLYRDYFGPAGFAMITLDMPSVGHSSHWSLTEDTSRLHQALLQQVKEVPWVDHTRVAMLGLRFGANAAIRLAFLEPSRLKTAISVGGALHSSLADPKRLDAMPRMYLDMIASRMGKHGVSKKSLTSHLPAWSLKLQGLLGRRKLDIPMLAIGLKGDPVCSEFDNQLVAMSSRGGKALQLPETPLHDGYHRTMVAVVDWLKEKLA
ncbi:esterase FrsA [Photobacterium japonica]|uniref:esterase FrsA n=1 Tax=Photobacterium japonica TaxID=2910235 RepID=UPI003D097F55